MQCFLIYNPLNIICVLIVFKSYSNQRIVLFIEKEIPVFKYILFGFSFRNNIIIRVWKGFNLDNGNIGFAILRFKTSLVLLQQQSLLCDSYSTLSLSSNIVLCFIIKTKSSTKFYHFNVFFCVTFHALEILYGCFLTSEYCKIWSKVFPVTGPFA